MMTETQSRELIQKTGQFIVGRTEINVNCPECDDDKHHMYINFSKMVYICFKCGAKGKITNDYEYYDYDKLDKLYPSNTYKLRTSVVQSVIKQSKKEIRNLPLSSAFRTNDETTYPNRIPAFQYLLNRGLTTKQIYRYCLLSNETSGPYKDTVIFPIYNTLGMSDKNNGQLKYFVCRRYTDQKPKYVNAPWPKDDTLFIAVDDSHRVNNMIPNTVVIVEGVFDALAVARAQYTGVALLGKRATTKQLQRLVDNYEKFIICLDSDAFSYSVELMFSLRTMSDISSKKTQSRIILVENRGDIADMAKENLDGLRGTLDDFYLGFNKKS